INEAAILAARANKKVIGMEELEEAIARVIVGPEKKSRRISEKEKEVIAYHEVGHALVMKSLPLCDPVHKVSIISRGMALGWTLSLPEEDKYLVSREELKQKISGIMGGRAAEEIVFGDVTSGAENDIQRATQLARRMVTQWGMSEKLGTVMMGHKEELVFLGRDLGEQRNYSEEVAALIDEEVRNIIQQGYETAKRILTAKRSHLDAVVERLMVVETIDAAELESLTAQAPRDNAAAAAGARRRHRARVGRRRLPPAASVSLAAAGGGFPWRHLRHRRDGARAAGGAGGARRPPRRPRATRPRRPASALPCGGGPRL